MFFNREAIPLTQDDDREVVIRPVTFHLTVFDAEYLNSNYAGYYLVRDFVADSIYRLLMDSVESNLSLIKDLYYLQSNHSRSYELSHEVLLRCANKVATEIHDSISHDKYGIYAIRSGPVRVDIGVDSLGFNKAVAKELILLG